MKMLKFMLLLVRYGLAGKHVSQAGAHVCLDRRMASENHKMVYPSLDNYEVGARAASEEQYPWIARVVHSTSAQFPHVCTAVCIDPAIFITAMRCIYGLKVIYTRVVYQGQSLPVRAFVIPSNITQDAFDDIGFIVVNGVDNSGEWATIERFHTPNRTDNLFYWFDPGKIPYELTSFRVVGYSMKKMYHKLRVAERLHFLTELNIHIGINICEKLITKNAIKGLRVPCYHSCTLLEQSNNDLKCIGYHGVEGGAVFDTTSNKLLGVATWGYPPNEERDFPVGFAVPNSDNFYKDFTCARLIRNDTSISITKGYYQKLCDSS